MLCNCFVKASLILGRDFFAENGFSVNYMLRIVHVSVSVSILRILSGSSLFHSQCAAFTDGF